MELEVGPGALLSRFTTVEGLLTATKEQLEQQGSFMLGDSALPEANTTMSEFLQRFDEMIALKRKVHLVLDDPAGNSYIQVGWRAIHSVFLAVNETIRIV
ncbi:unnamed protein product [Anisakis simplex]|uniref:Zinc finger ZPR1-type domain-containing protein n=1 Tax=Anisakis simplex TaxID=6269 RepID=A0A3P6PHR1_ANISI|nr:unnamed protein product [Anisakis simplex]